MECWVALSDHSYRLCMHVHKQINERAKAAGQEVSSYRTTCLPALCGWMIQSTLGHKAELLRCYHRSSRKV